MASGTGQLPQPGTCNGASQATLPGGAPEDGEPEMHTKMCKKIAQLTKVIYALNMKNDEHEASIQALKEAHREETQRILAETREAALHYRSKVEKEQELRQRIQTLEAALEQLRPLKEEAPAEFTTFRKQEDKREPPAESERAEEEIPLPKEMLHMKPDSENRARTSNQPSDSLLNEQGPFEGERLNIKGDLNEKGSMEMWTLIRETETLRRENQKLATEYAQKAGQLQASHERDRETWRKAMQQSLAEQRGVFEAREAGSQLQMRKLEADLEAKGQRISELRKHSQELKEMMQEVQAQLEALKKKHENEIKQLQREKDAMRGKLQDCSQEVLRLEDFIRQNQDGAKYAEFLKYLARKPCERQRESQGASVQPKNVSKQYKGKTKCREKLAASSSTKSEEKQSEMNATASRSDSGSALKKEDEHSLASFQKEKAKEIQALQEEWSYQKAELQAQEAEEHQKKESKESVKVQQELTREAMQRELKKRWQRQSLLIESLRTELAVQQASCVVHEKEKDDLQEELRNLMVLKRQQEENSHHQIQSLKEEVEKCQNELGGLKKENALLKDTVELLRADAALPKQTSGQLQEPVGQHRRFQELEETPRTKEPRPDLHLISCLQEKLNEKEEMIKELMDGRKLQPPFVSGTEPHRNRSFSLNMSPSTCLAPIAKKKKMDDMPSRIVSVPNLASYAKSFLSGDLRPKRNPPQITKSASLDQNPGCVRVCYLPVQVLETKPGPRLESNETAKPKEAQKPDPRPQEWFTKYFSF